MHKTIRTRGSGETMDIPNDILLFPGASSSVALCLVVQPEYRK